MRNRKTRAKLYSFFTTLRKSIVAKQQEKTQDFLAVSDSLNQAVNTSKASVLSCIHSLEEKCQTYDILLQVENETVPAIVYIDSENNYVFFTYSLENRVLQEIAQPILKNKAKSKEVVRQARHLLNKEPEKSVQHELFIAEIKRIEEGL